jgi:hypothetical protein
MCFLKNDWMTVFQGMEMMEMMEIKGWKPQTNKHCFRHMESKHSTGLCPSTQGKESVEYKKPKKYLLNMIFHEKYDIMEIQVNQCTSCKDVHVKVMGHSKTAVQKWKRIFNCNIILG